MTAARGLARLGLEGYAFSPRRVGAIHKSSSVTPLREPGDGRTGCPAPVDVLEPRPVGTRDDRAAVPELTTNRGEGIMMTPSKDSETRRMVELGDLELASRLAGRIAERSLQAGGSATSASSARGAGSRSRGPRGPITPSSSPSGRARPRPTAAPARESDRRLLTVRSLAGRDGSSAPPGSRKRGPPRRRPRGEPPASSAPRIDRQEPRDLNHGWSPRSPPRVAARDAGDCVARADGRADPRVFTGLDAARSAAL